jgi:putative salt-induced outer membrane protein YdiY
MTTRQIALLFVCAAFLHADQLTLKNKDHITGKVVKKDGDKLTFKSEVLGELIVPWEHVQDLQTDAPVTVVLNSGESTKTVLKTSEQAGAPSLQQINALRDDAEQLAWERRQHPSWANLWAGTATVGFAGAQGNAKTRTFTAGFNASRVTRTDKTTVRFAAIRSSALLNGLQSETAQAVRGGWAYDHNITSRLFLNLFNDYEYDRFQDLDLRFVLGGGLGYIVWQGERGRLDLLAGVAYNRESFSPPSPAAAFTRNSADAYVGDQWTYAMTSATTIVQSFRYFPSMSESGLYRLNFDLGANTRLFRWLTWNLAISDRFLSRPVAGNQKNDLLYTTGIGITFAH